MVRRWHRLLIAVGVLMFSARAIAQENSPWPERAYITIDVPFQTLNNTSSEALTFADTIRKTETAQFGAAYGSTRGPFVDVGTGIRLSRRLGVGATLSWGRRTADGTFDLTVPSLITGNTPLDLHGSVVGLERREVAVHLDVLCPLALGRKSRLMLAAGPSFIQARQDLVRSIEFDTLPGLTTLKFDQAFVTQAANTAVGFNLGADVTWNVATHFGIGTVIRYSRANMTLDPGSAPAISRSISLSAGGFHIGGGVRLRL